MAIRREPPGHASFWASFTCVANGRHLGFRSVQAASIEGTSISHANPTWAPSRLVEVFEASTTPRRDRLSIRERARSGLRGMAGVGRPGRRGRLVTSASRDAIAELLSAVKGRGSFAARRTTPSGDLHLEVKGVGPLKFPISRADAQRLRGIAPPRPLRPGREDAARPACP
jgi:hypothetical protein